MTSPVLTGRTCWMNPIATRIRCGRLATACVIGGCVHEHISESYLCGEHCLLALSGDLLCRLCWDGPDPHRCPVLAREVTR